MKTYFKGLLILCLFFASTFITYGQPGTLGAIKVDGESQGFNILDVYPSECSLKIPMSVRLANLAYAGDDNFILPPGHHDMYLQYQLYFGYNEPIGSLITTPLINFTAAGYIHDTPTYIATIQSPNVNIDGLCERGLNGVIFIYANVRLVTKDDEGEYVDYPACTYNDSGDIFSCKVFKYAGDCSGDNSGFTADRGGRSSGPTIPDDGCENDNLTNGVLQYRIHCPEECRDIRVETPDIPRVPNVGTENSQSNPNGGIIDSNLGDLSVYPNPVSNVMNVQWSAEESLESLHLYRSNGSLVKIWTKDQLAGTSKLEVQTDILSQGLYFIEARSLHTTKVIKVIKH